MENPNMSTLMCPGLMCGVLLAHLGPLDAEDVDFIGAVQGAAADAAPRHRARAVGQGDRVLRRHRPQVAALGGDEVWVENKRNQSLARRLGTGDRREGTRTATPAPALALLGACPAQRSPNGPGIRSGKTRCPRAAPPRARAPAWLPLKAAPPHPSPRC